MENAPTIENEELPTKEELAAEIERHLEYIRGLQEQKRMADDLGKLEGERIAAKIAEEYAIIEEKQKLLKTLN